MIGNIVAGLFTVPIEIPPGINYLVVAGGGGGGYETGGGGGGGGMRCTVTATGGGGALEDHLVLSLSTN